MVEKEFSTLYKKRGHFNSNIWDKWKCILSLFLFPGLLLSEHAFTCSISLRQWENKPKISTRVDEMKIKSSSKEYVTWKKLQILTNESYFRKTISQLVFGYGLLPKLLRLIVFHELLPSLFKIKKGILSPSTK